MNYKKILHFAIELQKVCIIGKEVDKQCSYISQGLGERSVFISGDENIKLFNEAVDFFWKNDLTIYNDFTRKSIKKALFSLLRDNKGIIITEDILKGAVKSLTSKKLVECEVAFPLYGVSFISNNPLELGPFCIYTQQMLEEKYPLSKEHYSLTMEDKFPTGVIITIKEKAKENVRLYEKAKIKIQQFEDIMRFIVGYKKHSDIGIFNYRQYKVTTAMFVSETNLGLRMVAGGSIKKLDLHNYIPNVAEEKIWTMLEKNQKTDLEKRILTAISWVGKGLRDEEPARAFVQYIFALESLLQLQQKNEMISPSITFTLSEFATFILANNYDERIEINKKVKKLYEKRSSIAHGSSIEVDENDLAEAEKVVTDLIYTLLSKEPFVEFKDIFQINNWVKEQKYM